MKKNVVLEKIAGETPLQRLEKYRHEAHISSQVSMAYAGRLDPMASGKLLVLIGDECKQQKKYHRLDKKYTFEVLLGTSSDTGDVLGLLKWQEPTVYSTQQLQNATTGLVGDIALPYPHFSAKTVHGKPLHVWTLEGRLDEIEIPVARTHVYSLKLKNLRTETARVVHDGALLKINSIPPVTAISKKLGNDFRRTDVRESWSRWLAENETKNVYIATFDCTCTSGTYMRSLAGEIGKALNTRGLAYSIHRTHMGVYHTLPLGLGFWSKTYT